MRFVFIPLLFFCCTLQSATLRTVIIKEDGSGSYTNLFSAEDGEDGTGNLVSRDEYIIFDIQGTWSSADSAAVTFDGANWTTDATHTITIQTSGSARHAGLWSTTAYRRSAAMTWNDGYFTIDGMQAGQSSGICLTDNSGIGTILKECIVYGDNAAAGGYSLAAFSAAAVSTVIRNCIAYEFDGGVGFECYQGGAGGGTVTLYNCTAFGGFRGYRNTGGLTMVSTNCIAQDQTSEGYVGTIGGDYNVGDIASDAPGANSVTGEVLFVSESAGSEDLHLAAGDSIATDAGTDLSGTFTTDIDGQTRVGLWDIGADEYVVALTRKDAGFFFPP